MNQSYAPDAFGFENVIFFTLEGADVSVARRTLFALLRLRLDESQCFATSRRFALNGVLRAVTGPQKSP